MDSDKPNNCKCLHCQYEWRKRKIGRPKACPECKRRDWDQLLKLDDVEAT